MGIFKKIRKNLKNTLFYSVLQNFFYRPIKSYSNCFGEDLFVLYYFSYLKSGSYIDIGCNQPKKNSLTLLLHERGWKGFNFDISERCINLFDFFRNKDINQNISIGDKEGEVDSYIFYENCSMNTVDKKFSKYTQKSVNRKPIIKKIKQLTLNQVFEKYNIKKMDYLNIDVEGHEMNVLKGFDIIKYNPKLVSIEIHDEDCPPVNNEIYKYFLERGYKLVSIYGWTYFFESKKNLNIHFNI